MTEGEEIAILVSAAATIMARTQSTPQHAARQAKALLVACVKEHQALVEEKAKQAQEREAAKFDYSLAGGRPS